MSATTEEGLVVHDYTDGGDVRWTMENARRDRLQYEARLERYSQKLSEYTSICDSAPAGAEKQAACRRKDEVSQQISEVRALYGRAGYVESMLKELEAKYVYGTQEHDDAKSDDEVAGEDGDDDYSCFLFCDEGSDNPGPEEWMNKHIPSIPENQVPPQISYPGDKEGIYAVSEGSRMDILRTRYLSATSVETYIEGLANSGRFTAEQIEEMHEIAAANPYSEERKRAFIEGEWEKFKLNRRRLYVAYRYGIDAGYDNPLSPRTLVRTEAASTCDKNGQNCIDIETRLVQGNFQRKPELWEELGPFADKLHYKPNDACSSCVDLPLGWRGSSENRQVDGMWWGPNAPFKVTLAPQFYPEEGSRNSQRNAGTLVDIEILKPDGTSRGKYRILHMDTINAELEAAAKSGKVLSAGTFLGTTHQLVGATTAPHLHIQNLGSGGRQDIYDAFVGK